MSAPPPYPQQPYPQNPYPQQPYPHQPYPQQPYGHAPSPQPPYNGQQAPGGPQGPQRKSPLHVMLSIGIVLAVFGGGAWYVWKYNTDPNGGKAKAEASRSAQAEEARTHDPSIGDCVKIQDPDGKPLPTVVDCNAADAEYKMARKLYGPDKHCGNDFDYGIQVTYNRGTDYTMCFTKVRR
ncbi:MULTISPECIES: LppU/SCO3897 family protein [Kitasatospora]